MKAAVYDRYGLPDAIEVHDLARPVPDRDQVLVRVLAASVNPGDWFLLNGVPYAFRPMYGLSRPRSRVLGLSVAGRIEELGADVTGYQRGDEVYAEIARGGFAEYACVDPSFLAFKPRNLTFAEAAAVPVVGTTALQAIRDIGRVARGQHVLVTGASGGVGTFAVQIAKEYGAEVTAVCGPTNEDLVRSIGADHFIDYSTEDFTRQGRRYDVILDNVADHSLSELRMALERSGTLIPNSGSGGNWFGPLGRFARAVIVSAFVRQRLRPFANRPSSDDLTTLTELIERERIRPIIDSTYPLDQAAAALHHYGQGHSRGKVVISVGSEEESIERG